MDSEYGEKLDFIRTFPFVSVGPLALGIISFGIGIGVLAGGKGVLVPIVMILIGAALLLYSIKQIVFSGAILYENAVVARTPFKTNCIKREDIRAIFWEMEGASSLNSRAPRRNQSYADIILKNGKTGFRMSSGFYRDLNTKLGAYQQKYNIARDLETKKKFG